MFHWEKRRAAQSPAPCHYSLWAEVDGQRRIQADLYPDAGFKSTGLFWNGEWYGPAEPDWADALQANPFLGAPILFPTPNRVRQHAFTFADRRYEMIKNGSPRAQHAAAHLHNAGIYRLGAVYARCAGAPARRAASAVFSGTPNLLYRRDQSA